MLGYNGLTTFKQKLYFCMKWFWKLSNYILVVENIIIFRILALQ